MARYGSEFGCRQLPNSFLNLLSEWREAHPRILLRFFEMSEAHELRTALAERRIDAAVVARQAVWSGAVSVPVYREPIGALPNGHNLVRVPEPDVEGSAFADPVDAELG